MALYVLPSTSTTQSVTTLVTTTDMAHTSEENSTEASNVTATSEILITDYTTDTTMDGTATIISVNGLVFVMYTLTSILLGVL